MNLHVFHKIFFLLILFTSPLTIHGVSVGMQSTPSNCMISWLESIGLPAHKAQELTQIFAKEEVEERSLEELTLKQLEILGVAPTGPRMLIFNEARKGIDVCKFGGTCLLLSSPSKHSCSCPTGTDGTFCEAVMTCITGFCLNGGTCLEDGDSVDCTCTADYSGERCQNCVSSCDINDTAPNLVDQLIQLSTELGATQKVQSSLISQITQLKEDIATAQTSAFSSVRDLLASLNGPRFFTNWTTLSVGKSGATDLTHLQIGPREFLAVLIRESFRVDIYEVFGSFFILFQSLSISSPPHHAQDFQFNGRHCIVVASSHVSGENGGSSELYCWDISTLEFVKVQDITAQGAVYVEHISLNHFDFLVFTCFSYRGELDVPSVMYVWSEGLGMFVSLQNLYLVGSIKSSIAQISSNEAFLSLYASYEKNGTKISNFLIYRWNGTYFDPIQSFDSADGHLFAAGRCVFVVLSNIVHRFDSNTGLFHSHSALSTEQHPKSAHTHFTINTEHYLAAVYINSDDGDGDSNNSTLLSDEIIVFRLDGMDFDLHQRISVPAQDDHQKLYVFEMKDKREVMALVGGGVATPPAVVLYQWSTCQ